METKKYEFFPTAFSMIALGQSQFCSILRLKETFFGTCKMKNMQLQMLYNCTYIVGVKRMKNNFS